MVLTKEEFAVLVKNYLDSLGNEENDSEKLLQPITENIKSDQIKLVNLIEALGPNLKDEDGINRAKSLDCLSKTLANLPLDKLSSLEVGHLVKFYNNKFDDLLAFKQVLNGLNALALMINFGSEESLLFILNDFIENYNSKNFAALIRYLAFKILQNIIYRADIVLFVIANDKLNDLFIKAFLNIAVGEKDPRNLMMSFELNELILKNFNNVETFKEDLFDVSFCYFPIAFKPPKNDPYKITSNDLKFALRKALTANEVTIDDLLPNVFEKLTSSLPSVKQDVLDTLKSAIDNFSIDIINKHWIEIWDSLKFEILHDVDLPYELIVYKISKQLNGSPVPDFSTLLNDEKEREEALQVAISSLLLFSQLAVKLSSNTEYLSGFLNKITEELQSNIQDSKKKLNKQSYLISSIIAQSSIDSYNHMIRSIFAELIKNNNNQDLSVDDQVLFIDEISFFLYAYLNLYGNYNDHKFKPQVKDEDNEFLRYKDEIIIVLSKSLVSSSVIAVKLKTKALRTLDLLISLNNYLTHSEIKMILNYLVDILLSHVKNEGDEDKSEKDATFGKIYKFCLSVLVKITEINSELVSTELFPQFFTLLPDQVDANVNIDSLEKQLVILSDLSSKNADLLERFFIRLTSKLNLVILNHRDAKNANVTSGQHVLNYGLLILNVLYQTLFKFLSENPKFKTDSSLLNKYVPILLKLIFSILGDEVLFNDEFVELGSRILYLIVLRTKTIGHQRLLDEFNSLFITNVETSSQSEDVKSMNHINLLKTPSKLINVYVKLIAGLDYRSTTLTINGQLPIEFTAEIITLLNSDTLHDIYQRSGYLQLLALVINKWFTEGPEDLNYLENQYTDLSQHVKTYIGPDAIKSLQLLEVFVWMAKALVIKNSNLAIKFVTFLIELIDLTAEVDSKGEKEEAIEKKKIKVGSGISKSFEILVDEGLIFGTDCTLTKNSKTSLSTAGASNGKLTLSLNKDKNNNVNLKKLYKQKLFETIIPKLITSFQQSNKLNSSSGNEKVSLLRKSYYLTAVSTVANFMSTDIILLKLEEFFPLLVESLRLNDAQVRVAALKTINSVIVTSTAKLIASYLSSLIPVLIESFKSSTYFKKDLDGNAKGLLFNKVFVKNNTKEVRLLALDCLIKLTAEVDLIKLMPFKEEVLKNLAVPLDDKKREVRKKACDCRQEFYELGQIK